MAGRPKSRCLYPPKEKRVLTVVMLCPNGVGGKLFGPTHCRVQILRNTEWALAGIREETESVETR